VGKSVEQSCFVGTRPARFQLAQRAFEDEPVGAGVAHAAIPEQKAGI
jgi:hypothetical protein